MTIRLSVALGLLSAAVIAFQLALMQTLAITQWHHFAYMIISVALLGFGAAGTLLALFRAVLVPRFDRAYPALMLLCGMAMAAGIGLSHHAGLRFDSYLLFTDARHAGRLLATYAIFFIPFLLAALAIGLAFTKYAVHIGALYFWNLAGSGLGGPLALGLMWICAPNEIPAVLALTAMLAGLLAMPKRPGVLLPAAAVLCLMAAGAVMLHPPVLPASEFKSASRIRQLPGVQQILERNSPYGYLQVVSSPALRYAPGLSLNYPEAVPSHPAVLHNGDWVGPLLSWQRTDGPSVLDYTTAALPYALGRPERVLLLGLSTGTHAIQAIRRGVRNVAAVEPNPVLLALLENELAGAVDGLLQHSALTVQHVGPRTRLLTDRDRYDLIVLPAIDTFGGTSGLDAIQEHYLLTKEAFADIWQRLTPGGMLTVTCWMDYPPRHTLRILATLIEMLEMQGVKAPQGVIAAVRSWGTVTFLVKKTPLTSEDILNVRAFCLRMGFDPALLPGIRASERAFFNVLQDDLFFRAIDQLLSSGREALYAAYPFDIRPVTDDRPYFAQFLRWKSLPELAAHFGKRTVPFFEIGYLVVILTLLQASFAALLLIAAPLLAARRRGHPGETARIFFYFSGIGAGYLFVEMALIQRFALYFGNPLHAAAIVISTMLIASGAGSYASMRLETLRIRPAAILAGILLLLMAGSVFLTPLMLASIGLDPVLKVLIALGILCPVAFLMGIPFPAGIRALSRTNAADIPWAWGINGCFSVVSAALATIVAVEAGFTAVMICAALAYGCTLAAGRSWRQPPDGGNHETA